MIQPFPPLPLDVAEHIVSTAARGDKVLASNLTRVSKQIRHWEKIRILLSSLPNLERLNHWALSERLIEEDLVTHPSLRQISCHPQDFTASAERLGFNSPFFQNVTHLDIGKYIPGFDKWSSWNWSSLQALRNLSHLLMSMQFIQDDPQHLFCIPDTLVPALPPSIQIVMLNVDPDVELVKHELYNQIRTGEVDHRVLLRICHRRGPTKWVLVVGSEYDGRFDDGHERLNGGDDVLWQSGMDMLRKRNNASKK
ncbi:hypothetical protein DL96DRAFT_1681400 [Flagelloscypha sp. PMI_526]|nr:hypothetical protein DL96DRAFT_1681400 [Flagelloscypha sp. PMI_526]